jgi:hypothetical protein
MRHQLGRGLMRTLQAASWWILFGQPPPLKTITSNSKICNYEPSPLSNAERIPYRNGSEVGISDAEKTETSDSDSPS